jgi:siroheme synthase, N-terminal domain
MFPINVSLRGRLVLMVGAGRVGRRKLEKLLRAGARMRLVEPTPDQSVLDLVSAGRVELETDYRPELMDGAALVFAATSEPELNRAVATEARSRGIWANVADAPELSDFVLPAVVERGEFKIAVATGGSPALAARTAARLREMFGPEYGPLAGLLAGLRPKILASGLPIEAREKLFKTLVDSEELRAHLAGGEMEQARDLVKRLAEPVEVGDDFSIPLED